MCFGEFTHRYGIGHDHYSSHVSSRTATQVFPTASIGPIDIATVADADNLNHNAGIEDLVQDPVVADPNPIHGFLARERYTARGPWFVGQKVDRCAHPLLFPARQLRDRLDSSPRDLDAIVAHASPSADLTSSQGT